MNNDLSIILFAEKDLDNQFFRIRNSSEFNWEIILCNYQENTYLDIDSRIKSLKSITNYLQAIEITTRKNIGIIVNQQTVTCKKETLLRKIDTSKNYSQEDLISVIYQARSNELSE